jgi:hypothetical protein
VQTQTEEALVPQRPKMADRMRGTHQRRQTATWAQPLPLKLGCGDGEILEQSRILGIDDWVCAEPA